MGALLEEVEAKPVQVLEGHPVAARRAVTALFFVNGTLLATWVGAEIQPSSVPPGERGSLLDPLPPERGQDQCFSDASRSVDIVVSNVDRFRVYLHQRMFSNKSLHQFQCVVTRRPSSRSASARTRAPVQTEPKRRTFVLRSLSQPIKSGEYRISRGSSPPATRSVSTGPRNSRYVRLVRSGVPM